MSIPALLQALKECPLSEVDSLRLILADALDDEGRGEEAEWVRQQKAPDMEKWKLIHTPTRNDQPFVSLLCECGQTGPDLSLRELFARPGTFHRTDLERHTWVDSRTGRISVWIGSCDYCHQTYWTTNGHVEELKRLIPPDRLRSTVSRRLENDPSPAHGPA